MAWTQLFQCTLDVESNRWSCANPLLKSPVSVFSVALPEFPSSTVNLYISPPDQYNQLIVIDAIETLAFSSTYDAKSPGDQNGERNDKGFANTAWHAAIHDF